MVETNETIILNRFPGTNFFEERQENIFFGREKESSELIHAIKAHEVYVIFANSGIGKTSLLNARLIPKLKSEQFLSVRFRFQDTDLAPLHEIRNKLDEYLIPALKDTGGKRLWDLYKSCDFGKRKVLFIFDQFEEFFNHSKTERDDCIGQLAELVSGYLPDYINQEMRKKFKFVDPTETELKHYTPIDVKFLFLIRADKLNLLDDLSREIPLILRNRFHLKPLTEKQAEKAILEPARLPQNGFATPPINFDEVYTHICKYLKNEEDEVESFQLQILCRELEKRVIEEYKTNPGNDALTITEEELGGDRGMSDIIQNYYVNQLRSIQDNDLRMKATLLIEDELIIENRRISLPEKFLMNKGYPEELLNYLVDSTRLIRGDRIRKERYLEISHDKLLSAILKSRQVRLDEDDKHKKIIELQRQKEEEEKRSRELQQQKEVEEKRSRELQREKEEEIRKNRDLSRMKEVIEKKVHRLRIVSFGLGALFLVTLLILVYANNLRVESKLNNVKDWINKEDYETAHKVLGYKSARRFFYIGYLDTLGKIDSIIEIRKSQKEKFVLHAAKGDTLKIKKGDNLIDAYKEYELAKKSGYAQGDKEIKKKQDDLQNEIDSEFKRYIDKMIGFAKAGDADDAKIAYTIANSLFTRAALNKDDADNYKKLLDVFKKKFYIK